MSVLFTVVGMWPELYLPIQLMELWTNVTFWQDMFTNLHSLLSFFAYLFGFMK